MMTMRETDTWDCNSRKQPQGLSGGGMEYIEKAIGTVYQQDSFSAEHTSTSKGARVK